MRSTAPASPARRSAILSPAVDLLCVGGLSLIVFVPLLLSGRTDLTIIGAGAQAWLAGAINMPHFMASYRIIYRSKEMILRHKWASIYVPRSARSRSGTRGDRRRWRSCTSRSRAATWRGTTPARCGG
jgi:hypothetical protein